MCRLRALKNKKGFTLVEIIVVLVILAILAAFGIPSMIGFIEDSRAKAYVSEARAVYIAVQAIVTEDAGGTEANRKIDSTNPLGDIESAYGDRLATMLAPDIIIATSGSTTSSEIIDLDVDDGKVTGLIYRNGEYYVKLVPGTPAEAKKGELTL